MLRDEDQRIQRVQCRDRRRPTTTTRTLLPRNLPLVLLALVLVQFLWDERCCSHQRTHSNHHIQQHQQWSSLYLVAYATTRTRSIPVSASWSAGTYSLSHSGPSSSQPLSGSASSEASRSLTHGPHTLTESASLSPPSPSEDITTSVSRSRATWSSTEERTRSLPSSSASWSEDPSKTANSATMSMGSRTTARADGMSGTRSLNESTTPTDSATLSGRTATTDVTETASQTSTVVLTPSLLDGVGSRSSSASLTLTQTLSEEQPSRSASITVGMVTGTETLTDSLTEETSRSVGSVTWTEEQTWSRSLSRLSATDGRTATESASSTWTVPFASGSWSPSMTLTEGPRTLTLSSSSQPSRSGTWSSSPSQSLSQGSPSFSATARWSATTTESVTVSESKPVPPSRTRTGSNEETKSQSSSPPTPSWTSSSTRTASRSRGSPSPSASTSLIVTVSLPTLSLSGSLRTESELHTQTLSRWQTASASVTVSEGSPSRSMESWSMAASKTATLTLSWDGATGSQSTTWSISRVTVSDDATVTESMPSTFSVSADHSASYSGAGRTTGRVHGHGGVRSLSLSPSFSASLSGTAGPHSHTVSLSADRPSMSFTATKSGPTVTSEATWTASTSDSRSTTKSFGTVTKSPSTTEEGDTATAQRRTLSHEPTLSGTWTTETQSVSLFPTRTLTGRTPTRVRHSKTKTRSLHTETLLVTLTTTKQKTITATESLYVDYKLSNSFAVLFVRAFGFADQAGGACASIPSIGMALFVTIFVGSVVHSVWLRWGPQRRTTRTQDDEGATSASWRWVLAREHIYAGVLWPCRRACRYIHAMLLLCHFVLLCFLVVAISLRLGAVAAVGSGGIQVAIAGIMGATLPHLVRPLLEWGFQYVSHLPLHRKRLMLGNGVLWSDWHDAVRRQRRQREATQRAEAEKQRELRHGANRLLLTALTADLTADGGAWADDAVAVACGTSNSAAVVVHDDDIFCDIVTASTTEGECDSDHDFEEEDSHLEEQQQQVPVDALQLRALTLHVDIDYHEGGAADGSGPSWRPSTPPPPAAATFHNHNVSSPGASAARHRQRHQRSSSVVVTSPTWSQKDDDGEEDPTSPNEQEQEAARSAAALFHDFVQPRDADKDSLTKHRDAVDLNWWGPAETQHILLCVILALLLIALVSAMHDLLQQEVGLCTPNLQWSIALAFFLDVLVLEPMHCALRCAYRYGQEHEGMVDYASSGWQRLRRLMESGEPHVLQLDMVLWPHEVVAEMAEREEGEGAQETR